MPRNPVTPGMGHWPMFSRPRDPARLLLDAAGDARAGLRFQVKTTFAVDDADLRSPAIRVLASPDKQHDLPMTTLAGTRR
jgi:hypothetical protein